MPGKGIPVIVWKAFIDADHIPHIAPSIEEKLMEGHQLNLKCLCGVTREYTRNTAIVVHHVIH